MHILVISNLYPPNFLGGYELAASQIVQTLRQKGHRIKVLTSFRERRFPKIEAGVFRLLKARFYIDPPFKNKFSAFFWFLWNCLVLQIMIKWIKPDLILVFNTSGLGGLFLDCLHSQKLPVVHDIGDSWLVDFPYADTLSFWFRLCQKKFSSFIKNFIKSIIVFMGSFFLPKKPASLNFKYSYFRSQFLKQQFAQAGFPVENSPVIYYSIWVSRFKPPKDYLRREGLIFIGRLCPEKGAHIFLEALSFLKNSVYLKQLPLTIVGPGVEKDYARKIKDLANCLLPEIKVEFTGRVPPLKIPELLYKHSIFVFPVIWDEPFGIVVLEAMAAGLAVISTATGGSKEILRDKDNCLIIEKNNPSALAEAIVSLLKDKELKEKIIQQGYKTVEKFDFLPTFNLIENHLYRVLENEV